MTWHDLTSPLSSIPRMPKKKKTIIREEEGERQMDRLTEGLNWKGAIRREPWRRRGDTTDAAKCAPGHQEWLRGYVRYWPRVTRSYTDWSPHFPKLRHKRDIIFGIQRRPVSWHSSEKLVALNSATVLIFQYWHLPSLIFSFFVYGRLIGKQYFHAN